MSETFKSAVTEKTLEIRRMPSGGTVSLFIEGAHEGCGINLSPTDAPALALAILEAAGHDAGGDVASADYAYFEAINWLQTCITRREEEAASAIAQAKLVESLASRDRRREALASRDKRRDELARELVEDGAYAYRFATAAIQRAVDRIIDLEAEAALEATP